MNIELLIDATEQILCKPSPENLIITVEKFMRDYMDCSRATFYLYDNNRNELYQRYIDEIGNNRIRAFSSQKGICGYVAST